MRNEENLITLEELEGKYTISYDEGIYSLNFDAKGNSKLLGYFMGIGSAIKGIVRFKKQKKQSLENISALYKKFNIENKKFEHAINDLYSEINEFKNEFDIKNSSSQ